MTDAELKVKCELLADAGCAISVAVLRVLADRDAARRIVESLADRVARQSELLSKKAEGIDGRSD